jgi:hypothetical protein
MKFHRTWLFYWLLRAAQWVVFTATRGRRKLSCTVYPHLRIYLSKLGDPIGIDGQRWWTGYRTLWGRRGA